MATSLDGSDPKTPSPSLAKEDAKERRAKIKQAIKEKKEKLSQQEYQQMIANHKYVIIWDSRQGFLLFKTKVLLQFIHCLDKLSSIPDEFPISWLFFILHIW